MSAKTTTTVRMFGALHSIRKDRGLASKVDVSIAADGCTARDLAVTLDLPLEKIEAVFINHRAQNLQQVVQPGDRVGFVPTGVPAPERFLLGIYGAGRQNLP